MQIAQFGHGRFGRAFADLATRNGHRVAVHDPGDLDLAGASVDEVLRGAELVVLAVPVGVLPHLLVELRPRLTPAQLVIDVGSVKTRPVEDMERILGLDIPWIGTHPLFGPAALARGERPLEVVVCPNALHPDATARVHTFLESIECQVVETDPETHDRLMARTHAMAFFLAKGLLALEIDEQVPFSPPSFRAMARTVETVRSDAGHLFAAIQLDNPYAAGVRQQFIDALQNIDDELAEEEQSPASVDDVLTTQAALAIPGLGEEAPDLLEARELIDEVDRALLVLMGRRVQLARAAGEAKAARGKRVLDPERERQLLDARRAWAVLHDLEPAAVTEVFQTLMRQSRRAQRS